MEAQEEIIAAAATTNPNSTTTATATTATTTIKGKRTKRQRVQSPIPFGNNLTANSSSGGRDGDEETDGDNIVSTKMIKNYSDLSPTSSQEIQESTQEEEDMANCLILLAQGYNNNNNNNITTYNHFKYSPSPKQDYYDNDAGVYNLNSTTTTTTTATKFNSRKFLETGLPGSGKAGYYVYECKTCNRTFPSFQALGGHRASHKKPKINMEEKRHFTLSSDEEEGHFKDVSSLSLQLSNNNNNNNHKATIYSNSNHHHHNKNKIHECSICGAEFTSGQALGGHMRRHRAPAVAVAASNNNNNNNGAALSMTSRMSIESEQIQQQEQEGKKARNLISLDLDLNLPAPDEEKLAFASKQQKQEEQKKPKPPLVFSGPTLVDCHY